MPIARHLHPACVRFTNVEPGRGVRSEAGDNVGDGQRVPHDRFTVVGRHWPPVQRRAGPGPDRHCGERGRVGGEHRAPAGERQWPEREEGRDGRSRHRDTHRLSAGGPRHRGRFDDERRAVERRAQQVRAPRRSTARHAQADAAVRGSERFSRSCRNDRDDASFGLQRPHRRGELRTAGDDEVGVDDASAVTRRARDHEILCRRVHGLEQRPQRCGRLVEELCVDDHGVDPIETAQNAGVHRHHIASGEHPVGRRREALAAETSRRGAPRQGAHRRFAGGCGSRRM